MTLLFFSALGSAQLSDHRLDHAGKSGDVRALVAGRAAMDHALAFRHLAFADGLGHDLHHVVADRLRQAGGVNGDHIRVIDPEDGLNRRQHVRLSAEDRRAFGERAGRRHHRLLVVAGQRAAVIRAAALRSVAVRQAVVDAQRGIHRADRLAGLGRIHRQCGAFQYFVSGVA